MNTETNRGVPAAGTAGVRMYPNNQLGKQYHDVRKSPSVFDAFMVQHATQK